MADGAPRTSMPRPGRWARVAEWVNLAATTSGALLFMPLVALFVIGAALRGRRVGFASIFVVLLPAWGLGATLVYALIQEPSFRVPFVGWIAWSLFVFFTMFVGVPALVRVLLRSRRARDE